MCVFSRVQLCNPKNWSTPGSSVLGIFQTRNTGVGCHFLLQIVLLVLNNKQLNVTAYSYQY